MTQEHGLEKVKDLEKMPKIINDQGIAHQNHNKMSFHTYWISKTQKVRQ